MAHECVDLEGELDDLFVEEVVNMVNLVGTLPKKYEIMPICTLWLNVFQLATPKERFARNYMLLLMHRQLNERQTVGFPFTDPNCLDQDLNSLQEMMGRLEVQGEPLESEFEFKSLEDQMTLNLASCGSLEEEKQTLIEANADLSLELKTLQKGCKELEKKFKDREASFQRLTERMESLEKDIRESRRIYSTSALKALKQMCYSNPTATETFFTTMFHPLCRTEADFNQIQGMNMLFKGLFRDHMRVHVKESRALIVSQAGERYDKLHQNVSKRYKKVIAMKLDAQQKELALSAINCVTTLRKLFLNTFTGSSATKKDVCRFLQQTLDQLEANM